MLNCFSALSTIGNPHSFLHASYFSFLKFRLYLHRNVLTYQNLVFELFTSLIHEPNNLAHVDYQVRLMSKF
jgi:hypothetical protein